MDNEKICNYCEYNSGDNCDRSKSTTTRCTWAKPIGGSSKNIRWYGHWYELVPGAEPNQNSFKVSKDKTLKNDDNSKVVQNGYTSKENGHDVGYVYILINRAMPNHIKIGRTTKIPELRAQELSTSTGVPIPFQVYHCVHVSNHSALEKEMHIKFEFAREHVGREFFILSPEEAKKALDALSIKYGH